jgi:hypothetical protein
MKKNRTKSGNEFLPCMVDSVYGSIVYHVRKLEHFFQNMTIHFET